MVDDRVCRSSGAWAVAVCCFGRRPAITTRSLQEVAILAEAERVTSRDRMHALRNADPFAIVA